MKKFNLLLFLLLNTSFFFAQSSNYEISSFLEIGNKAENIHHIGNAWINFLSSSDENYDYNIVLATFEEDATLDWHKHKTGQILIILEGEGIYQEKGKDAVLVKKGDIIKTSVNIEHWHSSTPNSKVSYLAIYGNEPTVWTEKLTKKYYDSIIIKK